MAFEKQGKEVRRRFGVTGEEFDAVSAAGKLLDEPIEKSMQAQADASVRLSKRSCEIAGSCALRAHIQPVELNEGGGATQVSGSIECSADCPNAALVDVATEDLANRMMSITEDYKRLRSHLRPAES